MVLHHSTTFRTQLGTATIADIFMGFTWILAKERELRFIEPDAIPLEDVPTVTAEAEYASPDGGWAIRLTTSPTKYENDVTLTTIDRDPRDDSQEALEKLYAEFRMLDRTIGL